MIPTYKSNLLESFRSTEVEKPKKVFKIDWENNRLLSQTIDGNEAVSQNIKAITAVEYQEHIAMPDWFGLAMKDMYGMPRTFVKANLERLVKEALSPYLVIKRLYDVKIEDIDKESLGISCTIELQDGTTFEELIEVTENV